MVLSLSQTMFAVVFIFNWLDRDVNAGAGEYQE